MTHILQVPRTRHFDEPERGASLFILTRTLGADCQVSLILVVVPTCTDVTFVGTRVQLYCVLVQLYVVLL